MNDSTIEDLETINAEHNKQISQRKQKLADWRESGHAFPNQFKLKYICFNILCKVLI